MTAAQKAKVWRLAKRELSSAQLGVFNCMNKTVRILRAKKSGWALDEAKRIERNILRWLKSELWPISGRLSRLDDEEHP